ncbi:putative tetratricopeptide repeat protein 41 [Colossoma macropomum]|uniref:putative tetratricopeptide repeat protein 41 n=1 Tax=Colossoma macropomum TaxID=42526 RepID=UPI001864D254|nr:putative tetratricopeptide repeat protein 41 [Colossoma macropomum]
MQRADLQTDKYMTSDCHSASRLASPLQPYLCYVPGDLQQELAYLKAHVFPYLDSLCQARGTCFRPVDIQQSKNDDNEDRQRGHNLHPHQAGSTVYHQQLKISLDLINSSSSFLCLLGQHYGCFLPEGVSYSLGQPEGELPLLSGLEQNLHGAVRGGYPWVMEGKHRACSSVELEITQAAFMGGPKRCFFYFKDCTPGGEGESRTARFQMDLSSHREYERQRLWDLKSRIINTCLPVRFFRNLQELEELVRKDWEGIIDLVHQVPAQRSISGYQVSVEVWHHRSHIQALCHAFVPSTQTTEVLKLLNTFVFPVTQKTKFQPHSDDSGVPLMSNTDKGEPEKSILLLSGERGCGKSSLAAWWLQNFRKRKPRVPVIPYFCGTSTPSKDVRSMLRQCTAELRKVFYGDLPEWADGLEGCVEPRPLLAEVQAFTAAAQLGPCVLLLDGLDLLIDTLGPSLQEVKELRWLPVALPSLCKLIVTTTTTDLTYKSLSSRSDVQVFIWPGVSDPCIQRSVLHRHLALPSKELPTSLLQRIMSRKLCRLPVFLAVLGSELRTCGMQRDKEEENELIEEYMEVDSVSELWVKVIRRWVKDYSRPAEDSTLSSKRPETNTVAPRPVSSSPALELRGWVWDMLCLIHVSRSGLTEDEVLALLEDLGHCGPLRIQTLEWARLRSAFGPWVQEKPNGLLCFSHQSISQTMELLLLGVVDQQNSRSYLHRILAEFFQRPSKELGGWLRKLEELPWHLEQTGSFGELHSVLTHPEALGFLSSSVRQYPQLRLDLIRYWTLLSRRGYDPISSLQTLLELNAGLSFDVPVSPMREEETFITEAQTHTGWGLPDIGVVGELALFFFDFLLGLGKNKEAENILLQTALQQVSLPNRSVRRGKVARRADGDSGRLLLEVQHMLAKFYVHTQQLEEAEMYCNKGLETANYLTVSSSVREEDIRMIKGQLLCFQCQLELERGGRLYSVPGILKEIGNTDLMSVHPCAGATVTLLQGLHKRGVGELSAAESCLQAALASRRRWYGSDHPLVAAVEEQLADIWTDSIHTDKDWTQRRAAELYRHVIHVRQAVTQRWGMTFFLSKPTLQDLTNTLLKLGKVLMQSTCKAEKREALSLLQRAADLSHLLNPGDPLPKHLQHAIRTDIAGDKKPLLTAAPGSTASSTGGQFTEFPTLHQLPRDSSRSALVSRLPGSAPAPQKPKLNLDKTLTRPWSAFQTSVFGPQSDIRSLVPRAGLCGLRKASSPESSARRPLPIRCHVQEEAVKALNRQMGTPIHKK